MRYELITSQALVRLAARGEVSGLGPAPRKKLQAFVELMVGLDDVARGGASVAEIIIQVIERSGYALMLRESKDEEDQERYENIQELVTAAGQFAREDPERTIGDFLETIALASDVDGWDEVQDCVSVMTLHAAKGLEFPVVFVAAVEHGILPHERSLSKTDQLEEERRLAFVGMTRAMRALLIVVPTDPSTTLLSGFDSTYWNVKGGI